MCKLYHTLAVKYDKADKWYSEFGDYEKEVVKQEQHNTKDEYFVTKIITTGESQKSIDHKLNELNA